MKKRLLSAFMALALCLTLLPTAALADELGPVDGTSTVETAGADAEAAAKAEAEAKAKADAEAEEKAEAEAKAKADAEAAAAVQAQIDAAKADIDAGALPKAHEALEAVRGQIGALHERNNIVSFSDRMNAYHAAMEEVLGLDLATTDAATLAEHAGVMGYLAAEIVRLPAPEAADNADYAKLQEAFTASVTAFDAAVKAGDAAAIKAAVAGLKVPYSKFFLMFG